MGICEVVEQELLKMGARVPERVELWRAICDAYERGGSEQVTEILDDRLGDSFEEMDRLIQALKDKL